MEVHTHTHTERKKWTHYFWEFFMLFMAVSAGFLVENQREHYVEHQRARVYAENLHEELKKDTAKLNYLVKTSNRVAKKLDTLCLYSTEKKERNITNGMLYYYASFTVNVDYFSSNNATMEELKGSGNLRLMKSNAAHKISEYDKMIRELGSEYQISKGEFEKYEALYFKIFDGYTMELITAGDNEITRRDSVFKLNIPLINDDPKMMKEFIGWMKFEQTIYEMQSRRYLTPLKQAAMELLVLLKKEYHLD
jgi:hypothetical protein